MDLINENVIMRDEDDTRAYAEKLAALARPGDVIALRGELGVGKTALTKYIAAALGVTENVTSPTFTIMRAYSSGRIPLYHFDAYRLEDGSGADELGLDEYIYGNGLAVIEWADNIRDILPDDALWIDMEYGEGECERKYHAHTGD